MEMLRDSSIGHVARFVSGARIFPYPDEQDKFKRALQKGEEAMKGNESEGSVNQIRGEIDLELATSGEKEDTKPVPPQTTTTSDGTILVGWYSTEDPENPQNWSNLKRYSVGLLLW
jgi:DHA1 family multidrug resistance protein-like MFS transporter